MHSLSHLSEPCLAPSLNAQLPDFAVLLDRWAVLKHAWTKKQKGESEGRGDVEAANGQPPQWHNRAPGASVALLHSDAERREFISAGAAAGLAVHYSCLLLP